MSAFSFIILLLFYLILKNLNAVKATIIAIPRNNAQLDIGTTFRFADSSKPNNLNIKSGLDGSPMLNVVFRVQSIAPALKQLPGFLHIAIDP